MSMTTSYRCIPGFFKQEEPGTDVRFDYAQNDFGLVSRAYETDKPDDTSSTQWRRFETYIHHLRATAPENTTYKLIWLSRHGQGTHNAFLAQLEEAKRGREAWNDHYSRLPEFLDAELTELGRAQAKIAHDAFKAGWEKGMPFPERYYVSPHFRCLETCAITFSGLVVPEDRPFSPLIKEMLREESGIHTCDRRRTRTEIAARYPEWRIEDGFREEDWFFDADHRETQEHLQARSKRFLDDVFAHDDSAFISFSTHSGWIREVLWNLKHPLGLGGWKLKIPTGAVLPVLVEAKTVIA